MTREGGACLDVKDSEGESSELGISVYRLLITFWIKLTWIVRVGSVRGRMSRRSEGRANRKDGWSGAKGEGEPKQRT
jgi:hypothetical protein